MESIIRKRLALFLEDTGTTSGELARALGISRSALYSKLHGETEFSLAEAYKLSQILGCAIEDLRKEPFETTR